MELQCAGTRAVSTRVLYERRSSRETVLGSVTDPIHVGLEWSWKPRYRVHTERHTISYQNVFVHIDILIFKKQEIENEYFVFNLEFSVHSMQYVHVQ